MNTTSSEHWTPKGLKDHFVEGHKADLDELFESRNNLDDLLEAHNFEHYNESNGEYEAINGHHHLSDGVYVGPM